MNEYGSSIRISTDAASLATAAKETEETLACWIFYPKLRPWKFEYAHRRWDEWEDPCEITMEEATNEQTKSDI